MKICDEENKGWKEKELESWLYCLQWQAYLQDAAEKQVVRRMIMQQTMVIKRRKQPETAAAVRSRKRDRHQVQQELPKKI